MRRLTQLAVLLAVTCVAVLGAVTPAAAHPMGNFSINHYSAISVGPHVVRVLYIVDMAEIPTYQELSNLNLTGPSTLSGAARSAYAARRAGELARSLSLRFDGRALRPALQAEDVLFPPGAGGLATERMYLVLQASLPTQHGLLRFEDHNFAGRAGWKEIVATGIPGSLLASSVPLHSRSQALTIYPSSIVTSPPQELSATLTVSGHSLGRSTWISPLQEIRQAEAPLFGPGGHWSSLAQQLTRSVPKKGDGQTTGWAASRSDLLTGLIERGQLSVTVLLLSLVVAFWFGAGHALSPGHGKTVVAAYLVGSRGTALQAAFLGLTVTATHTSGVFALGLVTLYLSHFILPDQLYPWLGFISGMLVAGMGLTLFVHRFRALHVSEPAAEYLHHHHDHDHSQQHVHRHGLFGRPHSHDVPEDHDHRGVSLRSLLALGVSGGLLPCPSALVVLLSAIAFHRLAFGILLIVAFSLGLATTLTGVGILVVHGGRLLSRINGARSDGAVPVVRRAVRVLPLLSALVVAGLGSLIAVGALGPGVLPSVLTRI